MRARRTAYTPGGVTVSVIGCAWPGTSKMLGAANVIVTEESPAAPPLPAPPVGAPLVASASRLAVVHPGKAAIATDLHSRERRGLEYPVFPDLREEQVLLAGFHKFVLFEDKSYRRAVRPRLHASGLLESNRRSRL